MEISSFMDSRAAVRRTSPTLWPAASRYVPAEASFPDVLGAPSELPSSTDRIGDLIPEKAELELVSEHDTAIQKLAAAQTLCHCKGALFLR